MDEKRKKYLKSYFSIAENREKHNKNSREYARANRERMKANWKKYYSEKREDIINKVKLRQKQNNYSYEKTNEAKLIRNIKRDTRYYFPLKGHNCEFCGKPATEHHHNTSPIEIDKFNYVCHICHLEKEKMKGGKQ